MFMTFQTGSFVKKNDFIEVNLNHFIVLEEKIYVHILHSYAKYAHSTKEKPTYLSNLLLEIWH